MKKTKILTVLGVLLAMGVTACGGGKKASTSKTPGGSNTSGGGVTTTSKHTHNWGAWEETAATCTEAGSKTRSCECGETQTEAIPALGHDFSDGAEKVDIFEEEGSIKEEMYKCKRCNVNSIRWSALDYDATKTAARSTKAPESRGNGKAIRFDSTANYQDADATKKGCHIVYNVYIPEDSQNLTIAMKTAKRTDSTLPPVVNMVEGDNAKGYEYVNGELVRPATRYGLKIDGEVYIVPEDTSGQEWQDDIAWYSLPGQHNLTAGVHEIEFYNLGGYRADFYEFALVGFGPHEHVAKFDLLDAKTNSAGKTVTLGQDKLTQQKAIEIAFKDFTTEPANPSGTNPWYMAKNSFATWTVNVDKAIEGAKIYFSLECSSDTHLERHLFNEAKYNEAHPDAPVTLPSQSPDTTDEDDWRYSVAVGVTDFPILNNGTMAESGVKAKNTQTYVYFADINLAAGENVIKLTQNNMGYRMKFNQNVRIVFSGDAALVGEHAHIFNQFVSETTASCSQGGEKVMKCYGCDETDTVTTPKLAHTWVEGTPAANSDGKNVIPMECSACHAKGAKISVNDYSDGAQFDSDADKAADAIRPKQNTAISYKISVAAAGNYAISLGMKCNKNGGTAMSSRGFKVSVGGADATVTNFGTATADSMGLNANTVVDVELVPSVALTTDEVTIAITCAGYRLLYGGYLTVYAI